MHLFYVRMEDGAGFLEHGQMDQIIHKANNKTEERDNGFVATLHTKLIPFYLYLMIMVSLLIHTSYHTKKKKTKTKVQCVLLCPKDIYGPQAG